MWTTYDFDDSAPAGDEELRWEDFTDDVQPSCSRMRLEVGIMPSLRKALNGAKRHFGKVGIVAGTGFNSDVVFAKIQLIDDDIPKGEKARGLVLFVILSTADDLYTTDFTLSVDERRKLFGGADGNGIDGIRELAAKIRADVNRVLSDLSKLEGMLEDAAKKG